MASYQPPLKNSAYTFYVWLVSQADTKIMQASPTLAAGDVKVAVDDAAPANVTDIPVVDADFTKRVKVTLTAAEMNGDNISVQFSDASGAEWCDLAVNLQTAANRIDDLATKVDTAQTDLDLLTGSDGVTLATAQGNYAPSTVAALATAQADLDTLTGTDGVTLATSQPNYAPATATALATTDGKVDTINTNAAAIVLDTNELQTDLTDGGRLDLLIDAIKAVTDAIPDGGALTALLASITSILADTGTDGVVLSTATQQAIADIIWDELLSGHAISGSTGEALSNAGGGSSPSAIADAIWDELLSGHSTAGTAGQKLNSISGATFPAGAVAYTYTVTDSVSGNPLEGVEIWISTDANGVNIVWKGDSDAFGVARDVNGNLPNLDDGTYFAWHQKSGYIFDDPIEIEVSA